jgi:hypothetical protein
MQNNVSFNRRFYILLLLAFISFLYSPHNLFADGKKYPDTAYKIVPKIPQQKAVIVFKDGVEKLIIESSLDGQGKEFAWIIPLPSKPTNFEKVSPGLIKTLSFAIQPKITHDIKSYLNFCIFLTVIFAIWFFIVITNKPDSPLVTLLFMISISFFILAIFAPALRSAGLSETSFDNITGINITDIKGIGSYDLAVLDANSALSLNNWLQVNGFMGLDDEDKKIVSDYIQDGWCFVAAKLKRDSESGFSQPHPLAMSFAVTNPIYPMKLTSTIGNDVYLEIFVISDKKAFSNQLEAEFSDKFTKYGTSYSINEIKGNWTGLSSNKYGLKIGHPDSLNLLWDGCVLTKLVGTLKPAQMRKDLVINIKNEGPFLAHYWSWEGAYLSAWIVGLVSFCILLLILTLVFYERIGNYYKVHLTILIRSIFISIFLGLLTFLLVPKINVTAKKTSILNKEYILGSYIKNEVLYGIYDNKMNIDQLRRNFNDYLKDETDTSIPWRMKNPYTDQIAKEEDSPGNYVFIEDQRGIVIRTFSKEGFPFDIVLKPKEPKRDSNTK